MWDQILNSFIRVLRNSLVYLISRLTEPNCNRASQRDDGLAALYGPIAQACYIGLAALTLTSFAGWFSATDRLARAVAMQLSVWFGMSTVFAAITAYAARSLFKYNALTRLVGIIVISHVAYGTMMNGMSAWSVLAAAEKRSYGASDEV
jgi:hypothetical protein